MTPSCRLVASHVDIDNYIHFVMQPYFSPAGFGVMLELMNPTCFLTHGISGRRGIVVACVRPSVRPSAHELYLVHTITRHRFELESPNLSLTCTLGYSLLVLKIAVTDLDIIHVIGFDLEF